MHVLFDYETKSGLPISVGSMKYLNDPDADIICMTYRIDKQPTKLWLPGDKIPFNFDDNDCRYYAYNIQFDRLVTNILGPIYDMPRLKLNRCIDVQALCARYGYPQNLEDACKVLRLPVKKDPKGKRLIKKITQPPFKYTHEELLDFYDYAMSDVESMSYLLNALPLPHLSDDEQQTWEMTTRLNERGIPIDIKSIRQIHKVNTNYIKHKAKALPGLTDGKITKPTQTARMVTFCNENGIATGSVAKDKLAQLLTRTDLPPAVREVLNIRQLLGLTSVAKYKRMVEQEYNGRIYGNLRFYGAHTGRWAGQGFQPHNLPRAQSYAVNDDIMSFFDGGILDGDPVYTAKSLVRAMIMAFVGKRIFAGDYSGIEMRVLDWLAGEHEELERIRQGADPYVDMAAYHFRIKEEDVSDDERFFGKTIVLGCGYQLGSVGFRKYTAGYGIEISGMEADDAVKAYREKHPAVRDFWKRIKFLVLNAIRNPGFAIVHRGVTANVVKDRNNRTWLSLKIPSGRCLYYNSPTEIEDDFGPAPSFIGTNPYTRRWTRMKMTPGRITENIVQALARDVLVHGKRILEEAGEDIILSVHDEIVCEVKDRGIALNKKHRDKLLSLMTMPPEWCPDLPLDAGGYIEQRYRKG